MNTKILMGIIVACLATGALAADSDPKILPPGTPWSTACRPIDECDFSFRGHRIGDAWKHRPGVEECDLPSPWQLYDAVRYLQCRDISICTNKEEKTGCAVGPVSVISLHYGYLDDKLVGFTLIAPRAEFRALRLMLTGRYGSPGRSLSEAQAAMNRPAPADDFVSWSTPHGRLSLAERHDTVVLSLFDPESWRERDDRIERFYTEEGKKAF